MNKNKLKLNKRLLEFFCGPYFSNKLNSFTAEKFHLNFAFSLANCSVYSVHQKLTFFMGQNHSINNVLLRKRDLFGCQREVVYLTRGFLEHFYTMKENTHYSL